MPFKSYKDESRANWGKQLCDKQQLGKEEIQLGATLRIADACELMAQNRQQLEADRDFYKRLNENNQKRIQKLERRIAGLRGHITRLREKK